MLLKSEVAFGLVRELNRALMCGLVHLCGEIVVEYYLRLVSMDRFPWLAIVIDSGDFSTLTPTHRYWTKGRT